MNKSDRRSINSMAGDLYPPDLGWLTKSEVVALCLTMLEPEDNWWASSSDRRYPWGDLLDNGRTDPLKRHLSALAIALWLEQYGWHEDDSVHPEDLAGMMSDYRRHIGADDGEAP